MAGKNIVRLVEFKMDEKKKSEVEEALEELLDEGFVIASQHEVGGFLTYTMVRTVNTVAFSNEDPHNDYRAAPQKYKLEGGVVVPVSVH